MSFLRGRLPSMRGLALRLGAALVSTLVTLLLLEGALALVAPQPFAVGAAEVMDADPNVSYRLRPGSVSRLHRGIVAHINGQGYRDHELAPRRPGELRILAIGDSFTFGTNVADDEPYPQVLEALLAADGTRPVEVINTGVPGWGPVQYAAFYEHEGRALAPDLVLVGLYVGNDAYSPHRRIGQVRLTAVSGHRVARASLDDPLLPWRLLLYDHSHLYRLIHNRTQLASRDFRRADCEEFSPAVVALERSYLRVHQRRGARSEKATAAAVDQLLRIARAAQADGAPTLVVLIPDEMQVHPSLREAVLEGRASGGYDFSMPQSLIAERLERQGVAVVDLLPDLRAADVCLHMNDIHWTPEAHRLAAEVLEREIVRRFPSWGRDADDASGARSSDRMPDAVLPGAEDRPAGPDGSRSGGDS